MSIPPSEVQHDPSAGRKKRIVFVMSDTGGGHRAAAEAIRDAILTRHDAEITLIDVFRYYSPFPLKHLPEFYPWLINHSKTSWGMGYKLSNTRRVAKTYSRVMYISMESRLKRMLQEHPADVVVSVHSVLTRIAMEGLLIQDERPPFMVVVTDLVSTHMFWYDKRADRTLLPSKEAFERGLHAGIAPEKMRVIGLPVHPNFAERLIDKSDAREQLGWDASLPTILIVGGGDGMGPLYQTARAINDKKLNCQIAVVAGRNAPLKAQLEASEWNQPTHIYGFVNDMPRLMAASNIFVTKAGPGSVCEGCIAGLPMIMYDYIPGQEDGNVSYIVDNEAGIFAPNPSEVADHVENWLANDGATMRRYAANALRIARPNAVWEIADEVWAYAQKPKVPTNRRNYLREIRQMVDETKLFDDFIPPNVPTLRKNSDSKRKVDR
jgi:1,2-diacylglycerol 3-beta-galactosyltransferase